MEEIKKKVFVGDSGNTAEVVEETKDPRSLEAQYAQVMLKEAGTLFCPIGATYRGSATVHYYSKKTLENYENFFVVCQANVKDVNEGHADIGWKQLKTALMQAYGREEGKRRDS